MNSKIRCFAVRAFHTLKRAKAPLLSLLRLFTDHASLKNRVVSYLVVSEVICQVQTVQTCLCVEGSKVRFTVDFQPIHGKAPLRAQHYC